MKLEGSSDVMRDERDWRESEWDASESESGQSHALTAWIAASGLNLIYLDAERSTVIVRGYTKG